MKGALAVIGLLVILCALVSSTRVRRNLDSWINGNYGSGLAYEDGGCVDQTCYQDGGFQQPVYGGNQQFNRNTVVNRVYAPTVYHRPIVAPIPYRHPYVPQYYPYRRAF